MPEVPDHLLQRSRDRRTFLAAQGGGGGGASTPAEGGDPGKIPTSLLERSTSGGATATAPATTRPAAAPAAGPAGHTQRLLTVVKAGSIQDVKAVPTDKVHTWPHLLIG